MGVEGLGFSWVQFEVWGFGFRVLGFGFGVVNSTGSLNSLVLPSPSGSVVEGEAKSLGQNGSAEGCRFTFIQAGGLG